MSSAKFYDHFIKNQVESGINDRIAGLYRRLCKMGLHTNSTVLEIGCGIGTLTYLLTRKVKTGRIEATDISPQSIEYVKKNLIRPNLSLFAGDILKLEPTAKSFDFVLLFDVIEHIPVEDHAVLFAKINRWMHTDSSLLINIPNPASILFDEKNNPAALQEIDQPVYPDYLATVLAKAGLDIIQFETYSVWVKNDYQFIVIKKRKDFEEIVLSKERNIFQKGIVWWGRKWRKLRYRYPPKL
ncbi:MAG: class I SAM-dependent methyltransferase [Bacteroidota bacterium]|nr:class I SAM-dependent methyltransferase [Chitinophagaceae bacterium]MDZ4808651.1 class I SAM-dependent methyltransferase [Bacteroidota bacterium]